ncbi:hypothetical protein CesoFtcFv8_010649 [Champsocephalus esox]|uniref:Uncharacterized protein n=1 Tax=Champsocephalus esox TaxID=159716 RepID=A0AAN8C506_9TELE|nr:hypothetical protein CesoFtcFv8_010649 [Champsocephalus esox]
MEKFGESPTSETKKALAAALIHGFPSLKDESDTSSGFGYWFTPGRNHRPATGFLEERLRNVRKRMRKPARSRITQQTPPQSSEAGTRRTFIPECTISEERAIQCKEWLKHNSQPLNQVEQYMQDTAVYRAKSLRENGWDIQGIRQEFPHLFTPGMIAQDFQILHREAAPKLFETWLPLFKDKILHLARREGKLISSLDGLTPDCLGELALSQLPTLLPPTVYRVGRKVFRYTIEESKLAFIDHKPVGTNLVEYLYEAKVDGRVEDVVGQETLTEDILHLEDTLKEAREKDNRRCRLQTLSGPERAETDQWDAQCTVRQAGAIVIKQEVQYTPIKVTQPFELIGMDSIGKLAVTTHGSQAENPSMPPMAGGEDERGHPERRAPGCRHVWREARQPSEAPDHYTVGGLVEDVVGQETLTEDILHLGDTLKEARENVTRAQEKTRQRLNCVRRFREWEPCSGVQNRYYWDIKQIGPDMELESEVINACLAVKVKDSNRENPRGQRATFIDTFEMSNLWTNGTSRLKIDPLDYHLWTLTAHLTEGAEQSWALSHHNRVCSDTSLLYSFMWYTIHRCGLNCRPEYHLHCCSCRSMLARKSDFVKHLDLWWTL